MAAIRSILQSAPQHWPFYDIEIAHIIMHMCIYVHIFRCAECTARRFLLFVLLITLIQAQIAQMSTDPIIWWASICVQTSSLVCLEHKFTNCILLVYYINTPITKSHICSLEIMYVLFFTGPSVVWSSLVKDSFTRHHLPAFIQDAVHSHGHKADHLGKLEDWNPVCSFLK